MRLKYLALSMLVLSLVLPESQVAAQRGGKVAAPVAEAGEAALAADRVVVEAACSAAVDPVAVVVACSAAADRVVVCNAAEVDRVGAGRLVEEVAGSAAVEAWNAVAVDLAAGFRPKAPQAVCSVKAQRWVLMAAGE